jgi:hypothetical protein
LLEAAKDMKKQICKRAARLLCGFLFITLTGASVWAQDVVPGLEVLLGEQKSLIEGKRSDWSPTTPESIGGCATASFFSHRPRESG